MELTVRRRTEPAPPGVEPHEPLTLLGLEWLLLQDPSVAFSLERPKLPGQDHPGLGIAIEVQEILIRVCHRLSLEGIWHRPAHYHVARVGAWAGTATVPLKDSTLVVPVMYTFTESSGTIGGMAMVPGQGSGAISNFVRDGARVQFRVTAPEGKLLEHDGKVGSDGAIEGMVNLDKLPIAKFRITQKQK